MASGAYNYVVTAHKPTSVTACATEKDFASVNYLPISKSFEWRNVIIYDEFYINLSLSSCTLFLGHLTSPTDLNLVIVRNNRVELHLVTPEGLKPLKELTIYGKISCLRLFKPQLKINLTIMKLVIDVSKEDLLDFT
ncbi:hypothetical protein Avbf_06782 [Armadillidium vulgare]|nr:hypothetical protein Avbf_06782 [Armadillidium vulgare]